MLKEIGSNFWIKPEDLSLTPSLQSPDVFGCKGSDNVWHSTGRGASAFVLDTILSRNPQINKVAIIPPFTCHTVIEPFLLRGFEVHPYHIGKDLMSTETDIIDVALSQNAGVVLFHRYFGFDTIPEVDMITRQLRKEGIVTIEDCTQNLYSSYPKANVDYFVGSIRKWCGVPDGGFSVCREGNFDNKPRYSDERLQEAKRIASIHKYNYIEKGIGEKSTFLNEYRVAEDILDSQNKYYTISNLSACIQSNLDVDNLKNRRRNNYRVIAKGLSTTIGIKVLFTEPSDNEVPLYCPILCDERTEVQQVLVKNDIYAPIVWPKADCCPIVDDDSEYLYNHILCIPIDQRYDLDDMNRIVSVVKTLIK